MNEDKFDPIKEFTTLRDTLSKAMEQGVKSVVGAQTLLVDIYETPDALVIHTASIDNIKPETLEVSVENGVLTISGETVSDDDLPHDATLLSRERRFGVFSRTIKLPRAVKGEEAQAKFKKGMLTITLPKVNDTRPQVIHVTPVE
ncbi:MAG: Hsp20/alpha crystallin family protein [Armatimonadetes bacterium]|nr:Hsp20/alpha crystallin family protein [Anaerolineae bacterium]